MRPRQRVELTTRDLEILQFVFEHRAVGHQQLANKFFNNLNRSAVHVRLNKLVLAKYLNKSTTLYGKAQTLFYSVTDKGVQAFAERFRYEITNPCVKSDSVNHDIGLVQVRSRLEQTNMVVEYLSESVLQSCNDLVESEKFRAFSILNSDAALVIKTKSDQYQVALEYEISDKQESRYAKKLTDYYLSQSVAAIFYICGNARIEKLIRQIDSEVGEKYEAKVFTCLEENVLKSSSDLPFFNRNNASFYLR